MNRYKVTADPLPVPLIFNANTEDEAWDKAKKLTQRSGVVLSNGTIEEVPTEAEKNATIARLRGLLAEAKDEIKMQFALRFGLEVGQDWDAIACKNKVVMAIRAELEAHREAE